jgi:hypothetical protein
LSLSASPLFWCFFFFRDRVSGAGGVAEVVRISLASVRPWVQTPVPPKKKKKIDRDRVSQTICPGWLWMVILLIFASWIARITDMSHSTWPFLFLSWLQ